MRAHTMTMIVNVKNFPGWKGRFIYVGRRCFGLAGHPLANPFKLSRKATLNERFECRNCYKEWLNALPNKDQLLDRLANEVYLTSFPLACWCAPLPCHADILAAEVDKRLGVPVS